MSVTRPTVLMLRDIRVDFSLLKKHSQKALGARLSDT